MTNVEKLEKERERDKPELGFACQTLRCQSNLASAPLASVPKVKRKKKFGKLKERKKFVATNLPHSNSIFWIQFWTCNSTWAVQGSKAESKEERQRGLQLIINNLFIFLFSNRRKEWTNYTIRMKIILIFLIKLWANWGGCGRRLEMRFVTAVGRARRAPVCARSILQGRRVLFLHSPLWYQQWAGKKRGKRARLAGERAANEVNRLMGRFTRRKQSLVYQIVKTLDANGMNNAGRLVCVGMLLVVDTTAARSDQLRSF